METIQVVIDVKLLQAADRAARQAKLNRSELVRRALREHLEKLQTSEREERDRRGYQKQPMPAPMQAIDDWEAEAVWPAVWPKE
jgi:Arc/MetJ-type ribon-helix-helix transcriptional regulator